MTRISAYDWEPLMFEALVNDRLSLKGAWNSYEIKHLLWYIDRVQFMTSGTMHDIGAL